jgi:hypothetical protein
MNMRSLAVTVFVVVVLLLFGTGNIFLKSRIYARLSGYSPAPDTVVLPCRNGEIMSSHITPAGDSLFTVLCPQGEAMDKEKK